MSSPSPSRPSPGRKREEEDSQLFGHRLIRPRRFVIPHPLVAIAGTVGVFAIYQMGQARGYSSFLDYAPWLVGFVVIFSYISRRSARNQVLRQQQELEELRSRPVWNLDDEAGDDSR